MTIIENSENYSKRNVQKQITKSKTHKLRVPQRERIRKSEDHKERNSLKVKITKIENYKERKLQNAKSPTSRITNCESYME